MNNNILSKVILITSLKDSKGQEYPRQENMTESCLLDFVHPLFLKKTHVSETGSVSETFFKIHYRMDRVQNT
jgi:hypothetical protein